MRRGWDTLSGWRRVPATPRKDLEKVSDLLAMSPRELSRVEVMQQLKARRLTQAQAAEQLGLSVRQVKRLWRAYRQGGAKALVSRRRGRPSNHQLNPALKARAVALIEARYRDFGPTLAQEKLSEVHHLTLSVETVRHLMTAAELWQPKRAKRVAVHPLRLRRARRGELVQIDGSPHAWFEERGPACSLLVYIDDATGQVGELFFAPAETTDSYFAATAHYLTHHGRPLAFYSDQHSIFRVPNAASTRGEGLTQFGRALQDLDIALLCAHSPQAKGRVERANQTLQDRLVKELRLRGIRDLAAGNAYLPEFLADFNRRFAVPARDPQDAHRPLLPHHDLARIFTLQTPRTVSQHLTVQYNQQVYQLLQPERTFAFRGARVLVLDDLHGSITLEYQGRALAYRRLQPQSHQAALVPSKQIDTVLAALAQPKSASPKPAADHPWRTYGTPLTQPPPSARAHSAQPAPGG